MPIRIGPQGGVLSRGPLGPSGKFTQLLASLIGYVPGAVPGATNVQQAIDALAASLAPTWRTAVLDDGPVDETEITLLEGASITIPLAELTGGELVLVTAVIAFTWVGENVVTVYGFADGSGAQSQFWEQGTTGQTLVAESGHSLIYPFQAELEIDAEPPPAADVTIELRAQALNAGASVAVGHMAARVIRP